MQKSVLGIDLGEDYLSAVLMKNSLKTNRIVDYRYISFDNFEQDIEQKFLDALKGIRKSLLLKNTVVSISIPAERVFFRSLKVPFKNRNKIRQILPYELETELPLPVENLLVDFLQVARMKEQFLIAAAIEKNYYKTILDMLANSGIEPVRVTPTGSDIGYCLIHFMQLPEQALILHAGRFSATLVSVMAQEITSIRPFRIPPGGSARVKTLCRGIYQTIIALEEMHSTSFSPECILMTGSTENFEGLETALKKRLDIPIRIHETDLVREIENFQDTYDPKWSAPHLNNAVASALAQIYGYRELNFKTNPFGTKTFWRNHKASLIKTGSLAVAVFLIFLMNMLIGNCLMEKRLAQLEGKIESIFRSAFPDTSRIEDAVLQMQIKLREAGGKDTAFPGLQNNIRAIDILNEISKRIPENADVKLDQLILGKESLQFSGNTGNFNTINDIQSRLEPVPFFKKVMISTASVDRSGKQVRFKINADLGNP